MAHIADLMVEAETTMGLNNYIARELSPSPVQDVVTETATATSQAEEREKFVWRMHQPTESRKYQLFPSKDKLSIAAKKSQEDMLLSGSSDKAQSILGTSARGRAKEPTLVRRRKVSVPELGPTPMTTVQEIAMDSPTIPGRPALHERSISAPGNWRQHPFGESMLSCISGPALDENAEMILDDSAQEENLGNHLSRTFTPSPPTRQPLSPKTLAPLVIPTTSSHRLNSRSSSRLRSGSIPPDVPPKSAHTREGTSPYPRASPYTPMSASSLLSNSTAPTSVANTPNSAFPAIKEGRTSSPTPQPWSSTATLIPSLPTRSTTPTPNFTSSSAGNGGHSRNQSDATLAETSHQRSNTHSHIHSHRRHESESSASIIDRGRPKKRSDISPSTNTSPVKAISRSQSKSGRSLSVSNVTCTSSSTEQNTASTEAKDQTAVAKSQAKADAQHAFEHLPTGVRPHLAPNHLPLSELALLKKQALGQASRFQVLPTHSVEALSRELRALDERCEYLRKTHRSLRSGRRNLHERICNYLRGERTAVFSRESLLRQEEALSELDNSIDDWVAKLEQAENRRTRVRQKLLEHVAAALIIPEPPASGLALTNLTALTSPSVSVATSKAHVVTMAVAEVAADPNTPPRSPTKGQSPERLERVVEEVKFSSPEPKRGGRHVESIRIYADDLLFDALLADVEEEIERMGVDAAEREQEEEKEKIKEMEKLVEIKKDDVLSPGIRLHAVAFEGMVAHKKSYGTLRV